MLLAVQLLLFQHKNNHMKAILCHQYGNPDVLQLGETPKPVPKYNEVLIYVKATAVNSADWRIRKPDPAIARLFFGLLKPRKKILGVVFSGIIEAIGSEVKNFKAGDEVFGMSGTDLGAYAEFVCIKADGAIVIKPKNISYTEAATIPFGATTALHFLKKTNLQPKQKILIYGASGAVGTAAVQLAKHYYQAEVTAVCSTANHELIKSLGADNVIDYTQEDISQSNEKYDVVFVTVNKISFQKSLQCVATNGTLILSDADFSQMLKGAWTTITRKQKILMGMAIETADDLTIIKQLIEAGKYKAVIDQTFPMKEIVAAHTYAEQGHKKGNVAILIE